MVIEQHPSAPQDEAIHTGMSLALLYNGLVDLAQMEPEAFAAAAIVIGDDLADPLAAAVEMRSVLDLIIERQQAYRRERRRACGIRPSVSEAQEWG